MTKRVSTHKDGSQKLLMDSSRWYICFEDNQQIHREIEGYTDEQATQRAADKITELLNCRANNLLPEGELQKWLEQAPSKMRSKLMEIRLLDANRMAAGKTLSEHLVDFESWFRATKVPRTGFLRTDKHVKPTLSKIRTIFEHCNFVHWSDIVADSVERYLGQLNIKPATYNHYVTSIKQFCNWMVDSRRASQSPINRLKRLFVDNEEHRRAFTVEEMTVLLATTENQPQRFGMTGIERAVLYLLAVETGLRVRELQNLTVQSFDFIQHTVTAAAATTKDRKTAIQLLKVKRSAQLKQFFIDKQPQDTAFNMPSNYRTAEMVKKDLEAAQIPYVDEAERKGDFHALRHTLSTNLDLINSTLKERMTIARHSDKSNLTLGTYTHVQAYSIRAAIERLPDFRFPDSEQEVEKQVQLEQTA